MDLMLTLKEEIFIYLFFTSLFCLALFFQFQILILQSQGNTQYTIRDPDHPH